MKPSEIIESKAGETEQLSTAKLILDQMAEDIYNLKLAIGDTSVFGITQEWRSWEEKRISYQSVMLTIKGAF